MSDLEPHDTFVRLVVIADQVVTNAAFLVALDAWAGRPFKDFDKACPPVQALADRLSDENAELARTFALLASEPLNGPITGKIAFLAGTIMVHQRRHDLAWNAVHSNPDPRRVADRSGWTALKPYAAMIEVMRTWLDALHQRATEGGLQ
jgi:hypothetical protein